MATVTLYAVTAQRSTPRDDDWTSSGEQLPTFYLSPRVQGITSVEHARAIARDIVGRDCTVHVERVELDN